jgi:indole-3-glycerol phosphate synthase
VTILHEILDRKKLEVEAARAVVSGDEMSRRARSVTGQPRGFHRALCEGQAPAIIAEIKRRSPSKGLLRPDLQPVDCARAYAEGGAAALSVLTDEHFFGGQLEFLGAIREAVSLPLLRKDFIVDAYQIDEARVAGADAVLLIVAALDPDSLSRLHKHAEALGLDVLVEVHDESELEVALAAGAGLIGVNNRNLATFEVDLGVTERLGERLASRGPGLGEVTLVAESGIAGPADVARMTAAGARAFLVGESLMKETDLSAALRQLRRSG